jgi:hypothetical protein
MAFLVLTRTGFEQLTDLFGQLPSPMWVTAGVLSEAELNRLREQGADITDFIHPIAIDDRVGVEDAVGTIAEHHPGQAIWVEYAPRV